ncbi:MAG: hypothetical protein NTU44_06345 [Bacteroidetes bacterium]|nr:hypothetical protein [Bacteroidota bacterium]
MISEWKRSNARMTRQAMAVFNNSSPLVKNAFSWAGILSPVASSISKAFVSPLFLAAELHKMAVVFFAERAFHHGKLSPKARSAWIAYKKAVEAEARTYDKFCETFVENVQEVKRSTEKK